MNTFMKLFRFKKTLIVMLLLVFCVFALSCQPNSCAEKKKADNTGQYVTYTATQAAEVAFLAVCWPLSTIPMVGLVAADVANEIAFWSDWGWYSNDDDD